MKTRRDFIKQSLAGGVILAGTGQLNASETKKTEIVIYIYEGMTALDAVGVYEVLRFLPDSEVKFTAKKKGPVKMDSQVLSIAANYSTDEIERADILVVPGGATTHFEMQDKQVVEWVTKIHKTTRWTTSVCTGSALLIAAGLMKDKETAIHWGSVEYLKPLGSIPTKKRVCETGKIVTSAGVSAGIDMALALVAKESGEELAKAIQLAIEYDPQPPFDSGSIEKASDKTIKLAQKLLEENVIKATS